MKKFLVFLVSLVMLSGCITSGTKIKVTDPETGNSVTVSEDGVELDVKTIEKDGVVIEVENEEEE